MEKKHKSLRLTKMEDPNKELPKEEVSPSAQTGDLGVTVAAFVLNSEGYSDAMEIGPSNVNNEQIRREILKAIQEEGESF